MPQRPMVALVGTRQPSAYGREMARTLARGLCEAGVCVVSGLARGIDLAVHESALEAGGYTVGVLGSGINVPYPPSTDPSCGKLREESAWFSANIRWTRNRCPIIFRTATASFRA